MQVIINEKSGGGIALKKWKRVCTILKLDNGSIDTHYLGANGSEDEFIFDSLNKGKRDFIIAGGDGTVNHFLNHLINGAESKILNEVVLGAVGIGSSNDFHKPFQSKNILEGIPYKINFADAVERDVGCLLFKKDGELFKKYFLINASIGVTAEGNHFFNNPDLILNSLKKISTQSAITYAAIKNIFTYKNFFASIKINNESFEANVSNVGIIKCPFFAGKLRYQSDPSLNNGLFDVHLCQSLSKPELINLLLALSKGKPDNSFNKKFWRADRITISSETEFAVEFDGEVITTTTVEFSVIPRLIKVCIN